MLVVMRFAAMFCLAACSGDSAKIAADTGADGAGDGMTTDARPVALFAYVRG
jgi:hypothetical protein